MSAAAEIARLRRKARIYGWVANIACVIFGASAMFFVLHWIGKV